MSEREKKHKDAMASLISGLTRSDTAPMEAETTVETEEEQPVRKDVKPKGRRGRPPRSEKYQTAYIVVRKDLYEKIKVIADKTGSNIKDVVEKSFEKSVGTYEKKFGTIRIPHASKIDIDTMFDE